MSPTRSDTSPRAGRWHLRASELLRRGAVRPARDVYHVRARAQQQQQRRSLADDPAAQRACSCAIAPPPTASASLIKRRGDAPLLPPALESNA